MSALMTDEEIDQLVSRLADVADAWEEMGEVPTDAGSLLVDSLNAIGSLRMIRHNQVGRDSVIEECALLCEGFQIHYSELGYDENERTAFTLAQQIREMKTGGKRVAKSPFSGAKITAHISDVPLDDSEFRPSLANIHDCDCNTSPHKSDCAIHLNRSR